MSTPCWYRTLGEEFGPVAWDVIEELARGGIIGPEDLVRCGLESEWRSLKSVLNAPSRVVQRDSSDGRPRTAEDPPKVPQAWRSADGDRRAARLGESRSSSGGESIRSLALEYLRQTEKRRAVRPSRRSGAASSVGWFFSVGSAVLGTISLLRRWAGALGSALVAGCGYVPLKPLAVGLSLVLVGAVAAFAWNEWAFRTRVDELLRSTWAEFEGLRDRDSDDPTWLHFKRDADSRLQRIAYELEHRAGPEDRVALELLWVARDYFPRVLEDKGSRDSHAERQLRFHLDRAESLMRQSATAGPDLDWLLVSVLTADGLLAVAAGLWFVKRKQRAPSG